MRRMPYGYNADTEHAMKVAESMWTSSKTDREDEVDIVRNNVGSLNAKIYVFAGDAIATAEKYPNLSSGWSAEFPLDYLGHPSEVLIAPGTVGEAMQKVAYWLAIAARLGYPSLTPVAKELHTTYLRLVDDDTDAVEEQNVLAIQRVITAGVEALNAAGAKSDKKLAGIYKVFDITQQAEEISETQRERTEQDSYLDFVSKDVSNLVYYVRGIATGEKPPGMSDREWFFRKWGTRLVIGGVGVGVLLYLGKPYIELIGKALEKKEEKKGTPTQANKRRRRRRNTR